MQQSKKYFLLYRDSSGVVRPWLFHEQAFDDITDIDLITLEFTKQEFLEEFFQGVKPQDLFIGRLSVSRSTPKYHFHYYECFFKDENLSITSSKIEQSMMMLALERQKKIHSKGTIELDSSSYFKNYVSYLMNGITSQTYSFYSFIHSENITDVKLKEYVLNYQANNSFFIRSIEDKLKKYKNIRMVSMEYMRILNNQTINVRRNNTLRDNYLYSSLLFDFFYDFPLSLFEAGRILDKDYLPDYLKDQAIVVKQILQSPFDSEKIEFYYEMGGRDYVLENMDSNDLYNASMEDLFRLGLINENEYVKRKWGKHR